jgi:hypothetical protein
VFAAVTAELSVEIVPAALVVLSVQEVPPEFLNKIISLLPTESLVWNKMWFEFGEAEAISPSTKAFITIVPAVGLITPLAGISNNSALLVTLDPDVGI